MGGNGGRGEGLGGLRSAVAGVSGVLKGEEVTYAAMREALNCLVERELRRFALSRTSAL